QRGPPSFPTRRSSDLGGHDLAHLLDGDVEGADGLGQVKDVDPVAGGEDVPLHVGVPTARLVTEVDPGLQHFAHADASTHASALLDRKSTRLNSSHVKI